jgi:elongation factor P--beta-lysine ligase
MFSGIIESLRTANGAIDLTTRGTVRDYYRNQNEGNFYPNENNDIDDQVIRMVDEYFNANQGIAIQTESLRMEITSHEINNNYLFDSFVDNTHSISVQVYLRNSPYGPIHYLLTKNEGGFVYIREKRIENRH